MKKIIEYFDIDGEGFYEAMSDSELKEKNSSLDAADRAAKITAFNGKHPNANLTFDRTTGEYKLNDKSLFEINKGITDDFSKEPNFKEIFLSIYTDGKDFANSEAGKKTFNKALENYKETYKQNIELDRSIRRAIEANKVLPEKINPDGSNISKELREKIEKEGVEKSKKWSASKTAWVLVAGTIAGLATEQVISAVLDYQKKCNGCWKISRIDGSKCKISSLTCGETEELVDGYNWCVPCLTTSKDDCGPEFNRCYRDSPTGPMYRDSNSGPGDGASSPQDACSNTLTDTDPKTGCDGSKNGCSKFCRSDDINSTDNNIGSYYLTCVNLSFGEAFNNMFNADIDSLFKSGLALLYLILMWVGIGILVIAIAFLAFNFIKAKLFK